MAHLTPEQFVDLAEGTTPESSMPHLAACDACRRELAEMRGLMSVAADVDVPEPSPLFWNHLSTRVHDAVAEEAARPRSWRERVLQPLVLLPSLGAALAVAIFAVVLPKPALAPDLPASPLPFGVTVTAPSTSPSLPPLAPFGAADDLQLTIVAAVATTVDWDEMRDEVAMAAGGTSDAVVSALTANEQRELQRLLAEEMAQPRAPGETLVKVAAAALVAPVLVVVMAASGLARAQEPPANPTANPAEVQRLFEGFAVVQSQQFLSLPDDQYSKFLPRFMALQTARRQALQQHTRVLNVIRKALNDGSPDDQISSAMRQLQDIDNRGVTETKKALEGVDQVLDLRQQARFRIFEEQMERRKLELVTRARQANRGR